MLYLTTPRTGILWSCILSTLRAGFSSICFDPWKGQPIYLFHKTSRLALWPIWPPIQWLPRALFAGETWQGNKVGHFTNVVSRLRISGSIPPIPPMPSRRAQEKLRLLLFYLTTVSTYDIILCGLAVWLLHWESCLRRGLCCSLRYSPDLKLKRLKGNQ